MSAADLTVVTSLPLLLFGSTSPVAGTVAVTSTVPETVVKTLMIAASWPPLASPGTSQATRVCPVAGDG